VLLLAGAASAEARGPNSGDPHVRPADSSANVLVASAVERSAIVRDLATQLKATDVIAYVRVVPRAEGDRASSIHFQGRSSVSRFMVILVDQALPLERQIALVGHELQHAVDMAGATWITDQARMGQYFSLIGWKLPSPERGFETVSAMQTERNVTKEMSATAVVAANRPKPR
jgi:hypothetical protein